LYPQPTRSEIAEFYTGTTGQDASDPSALLADSVTEQEAARVYLRRLERCAAHGSVLLLVAPTGHPFVPLASSRGYKVDTFTADELGGAPLGSKHYDAAVVILELGKAADPVKALEQIQMALKPHGPLLLVSPSMDSWAARFFGSRWPVWRPENLYYFNTGTIQSALLRSGFGQIEVTRDRRRYTLEHMYQRARAYPRTALTRLVRALYRVAPNGLRRVRLELTSSAVVVTARRVERRSRPLLSIVMPVFNERATFATTMAAVLAKRLLGVDKEIIVVESNSTDGTRDLVLAYRDHPGVKVVLEDRPRGKGCAVRRGLELATGDFIMIQDADLEYDVNDYDALLDPLMTYERAFVLGSRHTGDWKIRKFTDQVGAAVLFNLGHVLFASLLNILYRQRLRDPFTMYKVFRRDCLHGLTFECNRFDFDYELVIKLLRKGYVPIEIPVNYVSRSFKEGKKVSVLRDPLTWMRALLKFRFSPLYARRRDEGE
jgi:SAM-dependent methyltransferase